MPGPVTVRCPSCNKSLKLKDRRLLGKRVPCPKCRKPFVVEPPARNGEGLDDSEGIDGLEEFDDFGDYEDYDAGDEEFSPEPAPAGGRSRRGKSGRNSKRRRKAVNWKKPVLFGAIALCAVGIIGGAVAFGPGIIAGLQFGSIDLAWLPPKAQTVSVSRYSKIWNSSAIQEILEENADARKELEEMRSELGFGPENIASVTKGVYANKQEPAKSQAITVLRTHEPMDSSKLLALADSKHEAEHNGQTYYKVDAGTCVFFPDARTMVQGTEGSVKAAIDRGPEASDRPELEFARQGYHAVVIHVPDDAEKYDQFPPLRPTVNRREHPDGDEFKGAYKATCIGVSLTGGWKTVMQVQCTGPEIADTIADRLDTEFDFARRRFDLQKDEFWLNDERSQWLEPLRKEPSAEKKRNAERFRKARIRALKRQEESADYASASSSGSIVRVYNWAPIPDPVPEQERDEDWKPRVPPVGVRNVLADIGGLFRKSKVFELDRRGSGSGIPRGSLASPSFRESSPFSSPSGFDREPFRQRMQDAIDRARREAARSQAGREDDDQADGSPPSTPRSFAASPSMGRPVVVLEMEGFTGRGNQAAIARQALLKARIPWANVGHVLVDQAAGEIIIGVRGTSVNTEQAKTALEAAGFRIGAAGYYPSGRD